MIEAQNPGSSSQRAIGYPTSSSAFWLTKEKPTPSASDSHTTASIVSMIWRSRWTARDRRWVSVSTAGGAGVAPPS